MESQEEAESWNDEEAESWNDDEEAKSWNDEEAESWNEEEAEIEHPESETLVKPVPYRGSVKKLLEMAARERDRRKEEEETNVTSDEWNIERQSQTNGDEEETSVKSELESVKSEPSSSAEENKQERKKRRIDEHLLEDLALFKGKIVYRHRPLLAARVKAAAKIKAEPKRLPRHRSS